METKETKHDEIKLILEKVIASSIETSFPELEDYPAPYFQLTHPPDSKMGDYAYPCFSLAKPLKMGPPLISKTLNDKMSSHQALTKTLPAGPYWNFFVDPSTLGPKIVQEILSGAFFKKSLTENSPKTMIEFSQPNTHKEIHVGHMRNLCLGESLIRLHRYCGYEVVSATFPGDVGTHVAKCLWYLKFHNKENLPHERKGAWLGHIYTLATRKLEAEAGTEKEADNKSKLTEILKQLEQKSGEFYELWKETREWSIELMKSVYQWAGVQFDQWYWESEVDTSSLALVDEYFKKGIFIKDQGAIGVDLSQDKLGFCLLLKSDGTGLYATKDLELARRKFENHKIEKSLYVVDSRQAHHFRQVFKVLEKMGFQHAKNCHHLQYDFVELPEGPMSSRKGNIVPIQTLIDQMVEMIKTEHLQKYKEEWSEERINNTAHIVAQGAIKYGMLRMDPSKKIVFDLKEWLKLDGESGPYIQYVHARIHSLCAKVGFDQLNIESINWKRLEHPTEKELLVKLADFNNVAVQACFHYRPSAMTSYLYELSKLFNSFYAHCSIKDAEEDLKHARLALAKSVANILEKGLGLLGIPAPNEM